MGAKKNCLTFFSLFSVLFLILLYRAYIVNQPCKHNVQVIDKNTKITLNDQILKRFQNSLSYPTISFDSHNQNTSAIQEYVKFIKKEFNDLEEYSFVEMILINNHSILYKIKGTELDLKPYLFAAHFDVVPANAHEDNWKFDPFSATIDQDYIYARGTLDDKSSMIAQLEAVRLFMKNNGQPKRTIYLAYGHDEELSGYEGAQSIAKYLGNTSLEYVLDEGTMIIEDIIPGLEKPIAYISIAEKGYLTVKFYVNSTGGHSSMPNADDSALFIIADAITKLKANKVPSLLGYGPETGVLTKIAVHFGFLKRFLLSNIWIFRPIIELILSQSPTTDALIRTTTAVTIIKGGFKENVVPSYAEFTVNHRIHSLQSCSDIIDYDLKIINDKRIKYEILSCNEPSSISPITSIGYSLIEHTTRQVFPNVATVPSLMIAVTDSRFYKSLTKNIYKYLPIKIKNDELKRYHGIDERISISNYENMINFYYLLIKNTDQAHLNRDNKVHGEL